jgi:hypothetical protein
MNASYTKGYFCGYYPSEERILVSLEEDRKHFLPLYINDEQIRSDVLTYKNGDVVSVESTFYPSETTRAYKMFVKTITLLRKGGE